MTAELRLAYEARHSEQPTVYRRRGVGPLEVDCASRRREWRSRALWQRVKARQAQRSHDLGVKVKGGLRRIVRQPKYLLSGLLRRKAMSVRPARPARKAFREPLQKRVERIRHRLTQGGDVARSVLREIFPDSIWLHADKSAGHFYAIFEDGVRAALFADSANLAEFPIEESDAGLRKVGESGSGGPIWDLFSPRQRVQIRFRTPNQYALEGTIASSRRARRRAGVGGRAIGRL